MLTRHSTVRRFGALVTASSAVLVFGFARPGLTGLINGGGSAKSDCYVEFDVQGVSGSNKVTCTDGDPACDTDGACDGTCTFSIALCQNQTNVPGCLPAPLKKPIQAHGGLTAPSATDATATCGSFADIPVKLKGGAKQNKKGIKRIKVTAISTGKPKRETDKLTLICQPHQGECGSGGGPVSQAVCGANPNGGPDELDLVVAASGTDLDNGWTGVSHNFPVDPDSVTKLCLSGCDQNTNPVCDLTGPTGTGSINKDQFGAPLPLLAAGVPVCVVNRWQPGDIKGTFNLQTGEVPLLQVNLFSDVNFTDATAVCPRCSGATMGATGTCSGGQNDGGQCTTESVMTVANGLGNKNYALSRDCPPLKSQLQATLDIRLPLTSATATLTGSTPCTAKPGEPAGVPVKDDSCGGSGCGATCTGSACANTVNGQCVDIKGGVSQACCNNNPTTPCFPTANNGTIMRTGVKGVATPAWPDPTYPKTGTGTLAAVFCEGSTSNNIIDNSTGLPGPGALLLPGTQTLLKK